MTVNSVREPERDLPVRGEYDVVVLGGGPPGSRRPRRLQRLAAGP